MTLNIARTWNNNKQWKYKIVRHDFIFQNSKDYRFIQVTIWILVRTHTIELSSSVGATLQLLQNFTFPPKTQANTWLWRLAADDDGWRDPDAVPGEFPTMSIIRHHQHLQHTSQQSMPICSNVPQSEQYLRPHFRMKSLLKLSALLCCTVFSTRFDHSNCHTQKEQPTSATSFPHDYKIRSHHFHYLVHTSIAINPHFVHMPITINPHFLHMPISISPHFVHTPIAINPTLCTHQ